MRGWGLIGMWRLLRGAGRKFDGFGVRSTDKSVCATKAGGGSALFGVGVVVAGDADAVVGEVVVHFGQVDFWHVT